MGNKSLLVEVGSFLWQKKLWWIVPALLTLLLVSLLIILGQSSAVSPFIYALF